MTLAIAHNEAGRVVIDCVRERPAPFSPDDVVIEFAATLKSYGVGTVRGNRYGGEWPRERFVARGVRYEPAEKPKSDLYRDLLPTLNAKRVELLDIPRSCLSALLSGAQDRARRSRLHRPSTRRER